MIRFILKKILKFLFKGLLRRPLTLLLALVAVIMGLFSCYRAGVPPGATRITQDSEVQSTTTTPPTSELSTPTLDPSAAKVKLISFEQAPLEGDNLSEEAKAMKFPKLEIQFDKANFVMVLRCPQAHRAFFTDSEFPGKVLDFTAFQKQVTEESALAQKRYEFFWNQAQSPAGGKCVWVGTHVVRERIFDLAAPPGEWYYLLNPCVSKSFSLTEKEGCSYWLVESSSFSYESPLSVKSRELIEKLSMMEGEVVGVAMRIKSWAKEAAMKHEACETQAAIDAANEAVHNAWRGIGGGIIGLALGLLFPGYLTTLAGVHYGMKLFRQDITAIERYLSKIDCPEVKKLVEKIEEEGFAKLDELQKVAGELRSQIAVEDVRLNFDFNDEMGASYTNRDTMMNPGAGDTSSQ